MPRLTPTLVGPKWSARLRAMAVCIGALPLAWACGSTRDDTATGKVGDPRGSNLDAA